MKKYIKCIAKFYDEESDCIWAWFKIEDEDLEFSMPVTSDDFEINENYKIAFTHLEKIDLYEFTENTL